MVINFNNLRDENLKKNIENIFNIAIDATNTKGNFSVNVTIVGEKTIKNLNNEFRKVDKVTDVLSFPLLEKFEFEHLTDDLNDLGDIVICKKRAIFQAKQYGHSYEREMCFLALHGLLHLLGYDHIVSEDEKVMFGLQDKILKKAQMER